MALNLIHTCFEIGLILLALADVLFQCHVISELHTLPFSIYCLGKKCKLKG